MTPILQILDLIVNKIIKGFQRSSRALMIVKKFWKHLQKLRDLQAGDVTLTQKDLKFQPPKAELAESMLNLIEFLHPQTEAGFKSCIYTQCKCFEDSIEKCFIDTGSVPLEDRVYTS